MVTVTIGGQSVKFMVDIGGYSFGITGDPGTPDQPNNGSIGGNRRCETIQIDHWLLVNWTVNLGHGTVTQSFIVVPEYPYPLLSQYLLTSSRQQYHSQGNLLGCIGRPCLGFNYNLLNKWGLSAPQSPPHFLEGEWKKLLIQEIPTVWVEDKPPGLAKRATIMVQLTSSAMPISVRGQGRD